MLVSSRKRLSQKEIEEGFSPFFSSFAPSSFSFDPFFPPSLSLYSGFKCLFHSIMVAVMGCNSGDTIYIEEGVWGGER